MDERSKERKENERLRPRESNSDRITFYIGDSDAELSLFSESRKKEQ